ncbi:FtsH-binding integral membrane protein [Caldalkalibacillus uzonensis]|uniref:FtsH-binding integral membrane protein n=1 Tax=Caldalkalibacillus uzonensis TaxID=353224 RepID=A0ABU0CN81_9BACI|nr:hypothetical protein [Caldalkalibacillus uzonensis]MDQ0337871.1 FtsH-binding integral membrane protein [Caldalkalibacillus uzonensis]
MSEKTWRWLVGLSCLYLIIGFGIKVKRPDLFDSFYIYMSVVGLLSGFVIMLYCWKHLSKDKKLTPLKVLQTFLYMIVIFIVMDWRYDWRLFNWWKDFLGL